MKDFDKMFICWMDRIVWFIIMMVLSNVLVEITGVPSKRLINNAEEEHKEYSHLNYPIAGMDNELRSNEKMINIAITTQSTQLEANINTKILIDEKTKSTQTLEQLNAEFFNSIFNIPISTLTAVNHLVQMIFENLIKNAANQFGQQLMDSRPPEFRINKHRINKYRNRRTKELNLTEV